MVVIDTWGASGLCFADNDTEAVLKAMFTLKNVTRRTGIAMIVTDHLPLGNDEAWQKGNGAKSGNSGFVYRVTAGKSDQISIDCGKARGAPKAKSYVGKIASEAYGNDAKGRVTTVNVFKREVAKPAASSEQNAVLKLAAMLPGVVAKGMDALRSGALVPFDTVSSELGHAIKGEQPSYVVTKDAAAKMFDGAGLKGLINSGFFRTMYGYPFYLVYSPVASVRPELHIPFAITIPGQVNWRFDR
jgi:hypothetical protein